MPHRISGPTDIGIDFICEWVYGDHPTGILYAVQIKTFSEKTAKPKLIEKVNEYNKLENYEIKNPNFKKIDRKTLYYWKGFGLPIYLFAICVNEEENLDCYYKRFTTILTRNTEINNVNYYSDFYKVNDENSFIAFCSAFTLN